MLNTSAKFTLITNSLINDPPSIAQALRFHTLLSSISVSHISSPQSDDHLLALKRLTTQLHSSLQRINDSTHLSAWITLICLFDTIPLDAHLLDKARQWWFKDLIRLLNLPRLPPSCKILVIANFSHILRLAHENPACIREVVTPVLPEFIRTSLHLLHLTLTNTQISQSFMHRNLCLALFAALLDLLPAHPTIFRPFLSRLTFIANSVSLNLSLDSSSPLPIYPSELRRLATIFTCQLYHCSPKLTVLQEWTNRFSHLIDAVHTTLHKVFRTYNHESRNHNGDVGNYSQPFSFDSDPVLQLPPCHGILGSYDRISHCFDYIQAFLSSPSPGCISLPLGKLLNLALRILRAKIPDSRETAEWKRLEVLNPRVSKQEKIELWSTLPQLHCLALQLLTRLAELLKSASLNFISPAVQALTRIFPTSMYCPKFRSSAYQFLRKALQLQGPTLALRPDIIKPVWLLVKASLHDLTNAIHHQDTWSILHYSALDMLASLHAIPAEYIPFHLRQESDCLALQCRAAPALLSSALNPNPIGFNSAETIIQLATQLLPHNLTFEALIRPRMPTMSYFTPVSPKPPLSPHRITTPPITHERQSSPQQELPQSPLPLSTTAVMTREREVEPTPLNELPQPDSTPLASPVLNANPYCYGEDENPDDDDEIPVLTVDFEDSETSS